MQLYAINVLTRLFIQLLMYGIFSCEFNDFGTIKSSRIWITDPQTLHSIHLPSSFPLKDSHKI